MKPPSSHVLEVPEHAPADPDAALPVPVSERRTARAVLLVDPSSERVERLQHILEEYRCISARSADEAIQIIGETHVDLVVANARECSTRFLTALEARGLSRTSVFLAETDELQRLLDAYAALHTFRVLSSDPSAETLSSFVRNLLYPRGNARHSVPGLRAELALPSGVRRSFPTLDLSNRGLAVRVPVTEELLLPGTRIADLAVLRDDEVLVGQVAGIVRYLEVITPGSEGPVAYKVGLELQRQPRALQKVDSVLTEPARILAMLQEGLRHGSLTVRTADTHVLVNVGRKAGLDRSSLEVRIDGEAPLDLGVGDVVEGRFELLGASYSFLSSIARIVGAPSGYSLRAPRALRVLRQRRFMRVRPATEKPVAITVCSPFSGVFSVHQAENITASGVAFRIDAQDLLPVGTRISKLSIGFADGSSLSCRASVRTLVPEEDRSRFLCGVEFDGLATTDAARIADAIVHSGRPELRDGTGIDFDELWSFFLATGFMYPEKLQKLDVPAVRATMTKLLATPSDLMKTTLVVQDGEIQGHISGVLAYEKTWLVQHLTARSSGKPTITRGRLLNLAIIEYLEQLGHVDWIKFYYRPTNPWPARVFDGFGRKLADPALSHLATHAYMVSPTSSAVSPDADDADADATVALRAPAASDYAWIEAYFVGLRETITLRSDDLTSRALQLDTVRAAYGKLGLERRRDVVIAERRGRIAGFALIEISSQGLNFSELTNTFRVYSSAPDPGVLSKLIVEARRRYAAAGFLRCVGLASSKEEPEYQRLGFVRARDYACWTWHRSQYQAFLEHIARLNLTTARGDA